MLTNRNSFISILFIFMLALGVRFGYQATVISFNGSFDNGSDSGKYIRNAKAILEYGRIIYETDNGELFLAVQYMPLYPYFIAHSYKLFGTDNLRAVTSLQIIIDSLSVFAIALIAAVINRKWFFSVAMLASLCPSLILHSNIVLTESLFMSFFWWGLCALVWSIRSRRTILLLCLSGLLFGLALYTRPIVQFLPLLLFPLLIYFIRSTIQLPLRRTLLLASIPSVVMFMSILPLMLIHHAHYGKYGVSTQAGLVAFVGVQSFLREANTEKYHKLQDAMKNEFIVARKKLGDDPQIRYPYAYDQALRDIAFKYVQEVSLWHIIYSGIKASLRSVLQTGMYHIGYQLHAESKYFGEIKGDNLWQRLIQFVNIIFTYQFMFVWAIAQMLIFLCLPFQLFGAKKTLQDKAMRPYMIVLFVFAAYFLLLNSFLGDPKYGLPLIPLLLILIVAGFQSIYSRMNWDIFSVMSRRYLTLEPFRIIKRKV